jgi:tripeptidyl-peptidase II
VKRFFVVPPFGSTWMDVSVRDCRDTTKDRDSSVKLLVLHTLQVVPHADYRNFSQLKYINMLPSQSSVFSIPIEDTITCEVDIGRYWSTAGTTKVDVSIVFRGIRPVPSMVSMNCGDGGAMVRIHSDLTDEDVNPSAKLNAWKTPLRPKSLGAISVLGERDIQPWNGKNMYQLILTYEFTQDDKGSFTARAPLLQGMLYESIFESQIMMMYDGDKRFLGCSDAYPQPISAPKGAVVIRMQVRHGSPAMLEKLTDMVLWVERKLDKEITLSAYEMRESMIVGKRTLKRRTIRKGQCASVFFSEPTPSKIPQICKSGDILIGTTFYASGESTLPGQGKRPSGFPIAYVVGPKMDKASSSDPAEASEPKDERTAEGKMFDAIRDVKVEQLGKLTSSEKEMGKFETLFIALEKEYPGHLPLLMANLKHIEGLKNRSEKLPELVSAADKVIAVISEDTLAMHFGKKVDKEDPYQVKANKEMEKNKSFLVEALARKALAVSEMTTSHDSTAFDEVVRKLKAWVDIEANGKYAALVIERDCRSGLYGLALKRINKLLSKPTKEGNGTIKALSKSDLLARRAQIFEKLGYLALVHREKSTRLVAAPKDYLPF